MLPKQKKKRVYELVVLTVLAALSALAETLFATAEIILHVARLATLAGAALARRELFVLLLSATRSLLTRVALLTSLVLLACATEVHVAILIFHFVIRHFRSYLPCTMVNDLTPNYSSTRVPIKSARVLREFERKRV